MRKGPRLAARGLLPQLMLTGFDGRVESQHLVGRPPTALKFSGLWDLVSDFPGLVTVWLHVGRGGVTGRGGP